MRVGERRREFHGAFEIFDGGAAIAEFFKNAAEIEIGERVLRLEFDGGFKTAAGFGGVAKVKQRRAQIHVSFDPVRREIHRVAIGIGGAWHGCGTDVIREADLKPFLGCVRRQRENFMFEDSGIKFQKELLGERLNGRTAGPGLRDDNLAAIGADVQTLKWRGGVAELLAQSFESSTQSTGGNSAGDHALQSFKRHQIGEGEEALAPAGVGRNQPQPGPIVQLAARDAEHPHYFIASESLPHIFSCRCYHTL